MVRSRTIAAAFDPRAAVRVAPDGELDDLAELLDADGLGGQRGCPPLSLSVPVLPYLFYPFNPCSVYFDPICYNLLRR
jgi:hypothetical protein